MRGLLKRLFGRRQAPVVDQGDGPALEADVKGREDFSRGDGSATFVGLERVVGRIGSKAGSFVLQRIGTFENGQAKESYSVIPGSATGDLVGLRDHGSSAVGHGMEHPFELNYEFV